MLVFFILILGIFTRLVPHLVNFTPVAASALFGGTYLPKKWAIILPMTIMVVSDYFIGFDGFFGRLYVYSSFVLTGLIGLWIRSHKNAKNIIAGTFTSSVLFFLVTNFGVWLHSGMYERTLAGLGQSYAMGLPFFRNTVLGDFFYTGVFFGSYELAAYYLRKTRLARLFV